MPAAWKFNTCLSELSNCKRQRTKKMPKCFNCQPGKAKVRKGGGAGRFGPRGIVFHLEPGSRRGPGTWRGPGRGSFCCPRCRVIRTNDEKAIAYFRAQCGSATDSSTATRSTGLYYWIEGIWSGDQGVVE